MRQEKFFFEVVARTASLVILRHKPHAGQAAFAADVIIRRGIEGLSVGQTVFSVL